MSSSRLDETLTIRTQIERVKPNVVRECAGLSTATLHEAAGKVGALPQLY